MEKYPQLYRISKSKKATIDEVVTDGNGLDFAFSRVLNGDERRLMLQLVGDIEKAIPLGQGEDEISFKFAKGEMFFAKECYLALITVGEEIWEAIMAV
ncbi:hypothetical protein BVC80_8799g20 [Macleaya cordata]|uniref:Uncharacterized protein n=1 Tax=Macleaya cordata TaxID=56857 RepID=A0A200PQ19_MACCD|nr:hypothetical protein BVC80_8799g20 [Macleaya cordata]